MFWAFKLWEFHGSPLFDHATYTFFRFIMAMFLNACIVIKIKLCVLEQWWKPIKTISESFKCLTQFMRYLTKHPKNLWKARQFLIICSICLWHWFFYSKAGNNRKIYQWNWLCNLRTVFIEKVDTNGRNDPSKHWAHVGTDPSCTRIVVGLGAILAHGCNMTKQMFI